VRGEITTLSELPLRTEEIKEKTDSVASLRLDAIVSSGFNVSRTKAAELISSGKVSLNHLECESSSKPVEENDIIAVRGMGRIKLLEVGKSSRKGRIFITLGVYPGKNK
jgi:RNA-binding protein YlmH